MFDLRHTTLPGCLELLPRHHEDDRGRLVKTLHRAFFQEHGLPWAFEEQYHSLSHARVLRGMHFQTPPHDHDKLVTCLEGEVLDVVLDLRAGSPTFLTADATRLSGARANLLFIPRGLAHGFYVLSPRALLLYNVTSVYAPDHDAGILWHSIPFAWPDADPILSRRDLRHPPLDQFQSPFRFSP